MKGLRLCVCKFELLKGQGTKLEHLRLFHTRDICIRIHVLDFLTDLK